MHTVEEAYRPASELYWIAFLLTGHEELSLQVTMDVLNSEKCLEGLFTPQSLAFLRRTVIGNALAATQHEIAVSAREFSAQQSDQCFINNADCSVNLSMSNVQIEEALLTIELFPRCALLLTLFEGHTLEEAASLLQTDRDLVKAARTKALPDLTRNLVKLTRKSECVAPLEGFSLV